jgi:hypothetical protein
MPEQDFGAQTSYESRLSPFERRIRRILGFVAGWLMLAAISLLYVMPNIPIDFSAWMTFIILAPPAYLLAEGVGESLTTSWRGLTRAQRIIRVIVLTAAVVIWLGLLLRKVR